jgi:hypothetical protein
MNPTPTELQALARAVGIDDASLLMRNFAEEHPVPHAANVEVTS